MSSIAIPRRANPVATLRRLARRRPDVEQCEFCSLPLGSEHRHLLELAARKIVCACDPCALRFENVLGRWKLIPRNIRLLGRFQMADARWDALALPINLAFLFHSTPEGKVVAMYPSPAGAMQSLLSMNNWEILVSDNPALAGMQPDVEALLINRLGSAREHYIAPIDRCFELCGLIRRHWRGLSGGEEAWQKIQGFFDALRPQAHAVLSELEAVHA